MRCFAFVISCLLCLAATAQKIEKFYDYKWNECAPGAARFYGVITKTDSGWHRTDYFLHDLVAQMDGTYEDSACTIKNGTFYFFYPDKTLSEKAHYVHNKLQGVYMSFDNSGVINDTAYFEEDHPVGARQGWFANGYPSDSSYWQKDGSGVELTWFDTGIPSSAGRYVDWGKRQGKWQFFHKNGKVSALEMYDKGALVQKQYFDEAGNYVDTANHDHRAQFEGGEDGWVKYLAKHLYFPDNYKITNSDQAVVVVTFTVDEDGKVSSAYVSTPFYQAFDRIALNVIKHSPVWKPAVSHNRRVKSTQVQAVTFSNAAEPE